MYKYRFDKYRIFNMMPVHIDGNMYRAYRMFREVKEKDVLKVSATKLRNNLFDYLDKAAQGETIIIQRNNQEVARLVPTAQVNWRDKITHKLDVLVSADELIAPMEDVWEGYI